MVEKKEGPPPCLSLAKERATCVAGTRAGDWQKEKVLVDLDVRLSCSSPIPLENARYLLLLCFAF